MSYIPLCAVRSYSGLPLEFQYVFLDTSRFNIIAVYSRCPAEKAINLEVQSGMFEVARRDQFDKAWHCSAGAQGHMKHGGKGQLRTLVPKAGI